MRQTKHFPFDRPAGIASGKLNSVVSLNWVSSPIKMLSITRSVPPVLLTVSFNSFSPPMATDPNPSSTTSSATTDGLTTPLPDTDTVSVPSSGSLLAIVSTAETDPVPVGVKVTVTTWNLPGSTVKADGETETCPSDDAIDATASDALPVFENVSVPLPDSPTTTSPKARLAAETPISGASCGGAATPVPESDTVSVPSSGSLLAIVSVADFNPLLEE